MTKEQMGLATHQFPVVPKNVVLKNEVLKNEVLKNEVLKSEVIEKEVIESVKTFEGPQCLQGSGSDREVVISQLKSDLRRFERAKLSSPDVVSTGIPALDSILPHQGLLRGTLCEWIAAGPGSGATSLAMQAVREAQRKGPVIIVDGQSNFYVPALPAIGIDLERIVLVRPASIKDELWAIEQALRCPGVGAVISSISQLKTQEFRRLQLAAEAGSAIGIMLRPLSARNQVNWAEVRLLVSPQPSRFESFCRRLKIQCIYAKGKFVNKVIELKVCDETGAVRLAS